MIYVFMNPLSNNNKGETKANEVSKFFEGEEIKFVDVRAAGNSLDFLNKLSEQDIIVIAGGDGTLQHFVNDIYGNEIKQKIYLFASGSGNDFAHDVKDSQPDERSKTLIPINEYIKSLPIVIVDGYKKHFLNGIGFGIDGYCCEVGDDLRAKNTGKPINYAGIAIKGILGKFHSSNATITVDGVTKKYKHVILAPTMIGRFYGGGMMVAPDQNRLNTEKTCTSIVWHDWNRLHTLMCFPKIFKGEHVKYKKIIDIRTGHEISVVFDRPQALQIDGETIRHVTSYTVKYGI